MSGRTEVPGPRGSLLLGLTRRLQRDQLGTYVQVMAEYGDVVRLVVGPPGLRRVLYFVTHPDGVERVLAGDPEGYSKNTPFYEEVAAYLGNGLLTSGGQQWRHQRRTVAPLFSHRRVGGYVDLMADEAARLADRWDAAARQHFPLDLRAEMVDFTLRTVGRVMFGADVTDAVPVIRETFPILTRQVRRRGLTPLRLPRAWPTPGQVRAAAAQRALYRVVDTVIERRISTAGREESRRQDLISLLLAARDPDTGATLSSQEIRDQVLIFLLAGHETTSTALTFTLHLLGRHPDVQAEVHREVSQLLGGRRPRADDIGKLELTSMALREAMRLYPPAFAIGRLAETDMTIQNHHIPAGSIVLLSPWATHRHPDFWPEPERFDPRRFEPAAEAERPRYAYFPFAGGLRGCIGGHFAMAEAIVAVATLLDRYALEAVTEEVSLSTDLTLQPAFPLESRVSLRRTAATSR